MIEFRYVYSNGKDIKRRLNKGERNKDIATMYSVDPSLISHIKKGAKR